MTGPPQTPPCPSSGHGHPPPRPRGTRTRTGLEALGIALAVVAAVGGLAVVGLFVFMLVGLAQFGSNK